MFLNVFVIDLKFYFNIDMYNISSDQEYQLTEMSTSAKTFLFYAEQWL